jgi:hypothetical protein
VATTAELLVQAETAYHQLMIGTSPRVVVDQNGERIEYTSANRAGLYSYIQELRALIAAPSVNPAIRRPMRIWL